MSDPSDPVSSRVHIPTAKVDRVLHVADRVVIDLRSPAEFAEDHVPGAHNVPLFDDVERAVVGTLYRQSSPQAAFEEGRARTVERIGGLVREIATIAAWTSPDADLERIVERMCAGGIAALEGGLEPASIAELPDRPVALYCWRGGLRSRSVVALLREVGLSRALCLDGGYRTYRRFVRERLEEWEAPATFVLRGLTGVGKTLVLRELERLRPGWTLDLERLAGHRSSLLGMVGLEPCTQKTFDSRLVERLDRGFPGLCVMEGESRKVGDVILPPRVWSALSGGTDLELVATERCRVEVLVEDYLAHEENRSELVERLPFIERRLGERKWAGVLVGLLESNREDELVRLLLEHYYDPLYRHSEGGHAYATSIDSANPARAAEAIASWIEARR